MSQIDELLKSKKVIICCGSGGVGKTTISASLAVRAAELGLKTLVLTIDPARRLASSLGLEHLNEEVEVTPGAFPGTLHAAMLDMKRTFDEFFLKLAPTPEVGQRVLNNHVYQQLSTALNGSQEYTAMERLFQAVASNRFDLVILDTPPTKHALDFLNAPSKIHTLFQDSIMKWFLMPFTTLDKMSLGLMNRGTKAAFKAFEKLAGAQFLADLTDFFVSIRDWQKVLRERTAEVHRLLTSQATGFVLVTAFNAVKIEEARQFYHALSRGGFAMSAIIINRSFPLWGEAKMGEADFAADAHQQIEDFKKLRSYYDDLREYYRSQQAAFKSFMGETRPGILFARLPDFDQDVYNIEQLKKVADRINLGSIPSEAQT